MKKVNVKCFQCDAYLNVRIENVNAGMPASKIEKDSPLASGKKKNEAEAKIEALRAAGIDVSNLFSIRSTSGTFEIGRYEEGMMAIVPEDDPIFMAIREGKTIPDRRLFRRWVMAQVFHMLSQKDWRTGQPLGFTKALKQKGYRYQWDMVVEEMRVQAKLYDNDPENFLERNRWFNQDVVVKMGRDYINLVKYIVGKLRIRHCKGVPYIRLAGVNIFTSDLQSKIYDPLEKALKGIKNARTMSILYNATKRFSDLVRTTCCRFDMDQSRAFKDAYKGAGAFFTLKNLILFHDCVFPSMTQEASIAYLNYLAQDKTYEGYKLFGLLKDFLFTNGIDIEAKQREWRTSK